VITNGFKKYFAKKQKPREEIKYIPEFNLNEITSIEEMKEAISIQVSDINNIIVLI